MQRLMELADGYRNGLNGTALLGEGLALLIERELERSTAKYAPPPPPTPAAEQPVAGVPLFAQPPTQAPR